MSNRINLNPEIKTQFIKPQTTLTKSDKNNPTEAPLILPSENDNVELSSNPKEELEALFENLKFFFKDLTDTEKTIYKKEYSDLCKNIKNAYKGNPSKDDVSVLKFMVNSFMAKVEQKRAATEAQDTTLLQGDGTVSETNDTRLFPEDTEFNKEQLKTLAAELKNAYSGLSDNLKTQLENEYNKLINGITQCYDTATAEDVEIFTLKVNIFIIKANVANESDLLFRPQDTTLLGA